MEAVEEREARPHIMASAMGEGISGSARAERGERLVVGDAPEGEYDTQLGQRPDAR